MQIIDGKKISQEIKDEVKEGEAAESRGKRYCACCYSGRSRSCIKCLRTQ